MQEWIGLVCLTLNYGQWSRTLKQMFTTTCLKWNLVLLLLIFLPEQPFLGSIIEIYMSGNVPPMYLIQCSEKERNHLGGIQVLVVVPTLDLETNIHPLSQYYLTWHPAKCHLNFIPSLMIFSLLWFLNWDLMSLLKSWMMFHDKLLSKKLVWQQSNMTWQSMA